MPPFRPRYRVKRKTLLSGCWFDGMAVMFVLPMLVMLLAPFFQDTELGSLVGCLSWGSCVPLLRQSPS